MRLRLEIAYDGTDFAGWARQPGLRTVAGVLEEHLSTAFRQPILLTVAGRTDAGVHAVAQTAHCDIDVSRIDPTKIDLASEVQIANKLSRMLPDDVRILRTTEVPDEFDARFSALRRHYEYRLTTAPHGVLPREARFTTPWHRPLDLERLREASALLVGLHDFAAFCRRREGATTIRELQEFSWDADDTGLFTARVSADAFCWSMVRSLVGAVATVGDGRRKVAWISELLASTERSSSINVAEARGLTLIGVDYPAAEELADRQRVTRDTRVAEGPGCC